MLVWRLCSRRHALTAFTGEGARRYGGRWNLPGTAVVYTAESLSLAALELFVNLDTEDLPDGFVSFVVEIPAGVRVRHLEPNDLPRGWRKYRAPARTQEIGTAWAKDRETAVLSVPSAVIPDDRLYVLNPSHASFRMIRIGRPEPFALDPRLVARLR